MVRIYYAFLPLDTQRPGGVWWYRDFGGPYARWELPAFIQAIEPFATAMMASREFPDHGPMDVKPPASAVCFRL
jgi:hypothetical protein